MGEMMVLRKNIPTRKDIRKRIKAVMNGTAETVKTVARAQAGDRKEGKNQGGKRPPRWKDKKVELKLGGGGGGGGGLVMVVVVVMVEDSWFHLLLD